MPNVISSKDAPKLNTSALVVILLAGGIIVYSSSGAINTESPSTSSSRSFGILESSRACPKSPSARDPHSLTKKLDGLTSRCTNP
jgi:hypothetical protein